MRQRTRALSASFRAAGVTGARRPRRFAAPAGAPRLPGGEPEHDLQVQVAAFLDVALAGVALWSSIDHGAGKMTGRVAGRRKARGVKPGWPDVQIVFGGGAGVRVLLGIELKAGRGRPSPEQVEVCAAWESQGGLYRVCRSLAEVDAAIAAAGIPLRYRVQANGATWAFAGWEGAA